MEYERKTVSFTDPKTDPTNGKKRMVAGIVLEANKHEQMMELVQSYDGQTVSKFIDFIEALSHVGTYQIKNKVMVVALDNDRKPVSILEPTQAVLCGETTKKTSYEYLARRIWDLKMVNFYGGNKKREDSQKEEIRRIWSTWKPKFDLLDKETSDQRNKIKDEMEREAFKEGFEKLQALKKRTDPTLEKEYSDRIEALFANSHAKMMTMLNELLIELKDIPGDLPWESTNM